jgi:hypothetical protein
MAWVSWAGVFEAAGEGVARAAVRAAAVTRTNPAEDLGDMTLRHSRGWGDCRDGSGQQLPRGLMSMARRSSPFSLEGIDGATTEKYDRFIQI